MKNLASILVTTVIIAILFVSSGTLLSAPAENADSAKNPESDGGIIGTIPPGSPFAKISIGMSEKHVLDLIGPPTDTNHYITGKSFIPFYFGSDRTRSEALYKGMGRITYASGKVYRIVYDPHEKGYSDK